MCASADAEAECSVLVRVYSEGMYVSGEERACLRRVRLRTSTVWENIYTP
jgi:hypothetical protein